MIQKSPVKKMYSYSPRLNAREKLHILQSGYEQCWPGKVATQLIREYYVLHYIVSGKGTYTIDQKTYSLEQGDSFLLPAYKRLSYQSDPSEPWEYFWVGFDGIELDPLLKSCGFSDAQYVQRGSPHPVLRELFEKISSYESPMPSDFYFMIGLLYQIFSIYMSRQPLCVSEDKQQRYVEQVDAYIRDNYPFPITMDDISSYVGLERSYLYRIYKAAKGVSIHTFLTQYRLETAKYHLIHSNMSINDIAYFCGFSSQSHLNSAFRKETGVTPRQYRINYTSEHPVP